MRQTSMTLPRCQVGPDTARMLQLGHPWVIADRYTARWPKVPCGTLVELVDQHGVSFGTALLDPGARVVARCLPGSPVLLDQGWVAERLRVADQVRRYLDLADTTAWRLVNGEGDGLPGLTVDRYHEHLLLQTFTPAWDPHLPAVCAALQAVYRPRGLYAKRRPAETRAAKGAVTGELLLGQAAPPHQIVTEHGLHYQVDLAGELHTGLFLDQRANRRAFQRLTAGRRVLNLFAYTGAFSVAAAAGGAAQVTTIDAAPRSLQRARENFRRNALDPDAHEFVAGDCFRELDRLARDDRTFDVVLMDPPSFSTVRGSHFTTSGGTGELVQRALAVLSPGGLLVTSSNHQKVDLPDYLKELRRGSLAAGRALRVIEVAGQGGDFPYPVTFPEGRYLKYVVSVAE